MTPCSVWSVRKANKGKGNLHNPHLGVGKGVPTSHVVLKKSQCHISSKSLEKHCVVHDTVAESVFFKLRGGPGN